MKKNGLRKCKKNAEKYAKEMHKNARTKMSKEKFKKGKKFQKKNMSKDGIMVAHLFSNWKVMGSNLYLELLFFQVRKLLRDS